MSRTQPANNNSKQRGFSLLELLAVLLIVGLMLGLVSFAIGGNDAAEKLRDNAERFTGIIRLAVDDAVLSGEPLGLSFVPGELDDAWSFYWLRLRDGQWIPEGAPLQEQHFPEGVSVDLQLSGETYDWTQARPAVETPIIIFYPSGESQTFIITLRSQYAPDGDQHIGNSVAGDILWKERPGV